MKILHSINSFHSLKRWDVKRIIHLNKSKEINCNAEEFYLFLLSRISCTRKKVEKEEKQVAKFRNEEFNVFLFFCFPFELGQYF